MLTFFYCERAPPSQGYLDLTGQSHRKSLSTEHIMGCVESVFTIFLIVRQNAMIFVKLISLYEKISHCRPNLIINEGQLEHKKCGNGQTEYCSIFSVAE
jgi:hypothetical protein